MDYLPIFLDLRGRRCLLVGGGEVATRKTDLLLQAGGNVEAVAPELGPGMQALVDAGRIAYRAGEFQDSDLDGAQLVIAASNNRTVNARVAEIADARGIPVNVVDDPALCRFIMPAIVDRSPVVAAISTGGASPVLARLIRGRLEALMPAAFGRLAALAGEYRDEVKARISDAGRRRMFWERVLGGPIAEMIYAGRDGDARESLAKALEEADTAEAGTHSASGEVYLVGAGPGDPDMLTFRALRLMQQADVVVHDRLVAQRVLDLTRRDAPRIYAGKRRASHALPQESINALLVRLAREGKRVLRLKGGDPFIFGRGGEEIETLAAEGIPFQVVPGITAAAGCAAYAGIPLTHRDHAQSCVFVTGHLKDGTVALDWKHLVQERQTIVIYMGLVGLPVICRELIGHGMAADTPAALVEQGTTEDQRVITATIATLPQSVAGAEVRAPTLIIIGSVVRLREKLGWFETGAGHAAQLDPQFRMDGAQLGNKSVTE
jgi:uroporphyrin-III C-methyltransferase / precorrin-2 dehydrogenase / sirohydrochlorin ferrochelatase